MADSVNMSLDDIIRINRVSRSRGRGGTSIRGRGRGGRGRGRGRGKDSGGATAGTSTNRGRSKSRPTTPTLDGQRGRSRSRSRVTDNVRGRGRARGRGRSQSRVRSRSRQQRRSTSMARSASRSRTRSQLRTRLGINNALADMSIQNRIGVQNPNFRGDVHSRLGVTTIRGAANGRRPLALAKRGISKRGRGLITRNKYKVVGLRSDQILKEQRQQQLHQSNVIRTRTFTRSRSNSRSRDISRSRNNSRSRNTSRSRNNSRSRNDSRPRNSSFNSISQLTVSVANNLAKKRRNSAGNANYLNEQSLIKLNSRFGGYKKRGSAGSVSSFESNKSTHSNSLNCSAKSNAILRPNRARGRGRGRGVNRGVSRNFVQTLNIKLQKEIAAIQGKSFSNNRNSTNDSPSGINFTPTAVATMQTLHQRFATL